MLGMFPEFSLPRITPFNPRGLFYDPVIDSQLSDSIRMAETSARKIAHNKKNEEALKKMKQPKTKEPKTRAKVPANTKAKPKIPSPAFKNLGPSPLRQSIQDLHMKPVGGVRYIPE